MERVTRDVSPEGLSRPLWCKYLPKIGYYEAIKYNFLIKSDIKIS